MKKNKKGFILVEVFIISSVVLGVLVTIFIQFKNITRSYDTAFTYNTVSGLYGANEVNKWINENRNSSLNNNLRTEIINNSDLSSLATALHTKTIILTKANISNLKNNLDNLQISDGMKKFIKTIKGEDDADYPYRTIIEYEDEFNNKTYATLKFKKN